MLFALPALAIPIIGGIVYTHKVLGGENLSQYDRDDAPTFEVPENTKGMEELNAYLHEAFGMHGQSATWTGLGHWSKGLTRISVFFIYMAAQ